MAILIVGELQHCLINYYFCIRHSMAPVARALCHARALWDLERELYNEFAMIELVIGVEKGR